jgi:uncharacterized membrane protein
MAGIGFVLRDLDRRESLFSSIASIGHGALASAGPWIFTVIAVALIYRGTATLIDPELSYSFRGLVIYSFALSLLVTAPVVNVAIRQVSDDIYSHDFHHVRPRYIAALVLCCLISGLSSIVVFAGVFRLDAGDLLVEVASTMIVGMIWPTLAFCGAVKDYKGISFGFGWGLLLSVVTTIWTAAEGYSAAAMMLAFISGLSLVFLWLAGRVLATFPQPVSGLGAYIPELLKGFLQYWMLALGAFVAIAAVWMDKLVMWFGETGVPLHNGLLSSPNYDGAMFIAYLTIIPALGLFVTSIETGFFEDFRRLLDAIQNRAPLERINQTAEALGKKTFEMIYRVLLAQGTVCVMGVIASAALLPWLGLRFEQLGILRLGIIAAFFQVMFLTCSSILLFFDNHLRFLLLQIVFFVLQMVLTILSVELGAEYFGYGHLLACAISAFAAVVVLERTMGKAVYLTFAAALRRPASGRRVRVAQTQRVGPISARPAAEETVEIAFADGTPGPLLRP